MKKMVTMFFWCGISTFFWGALFGGWFGDAVAVFSKTFLGREIVINPIWIDPLQEPMTLLIFSLILGAIHMFVGMGMQAYMLIKNGKALDALFDVGLWYMLLIGLVLFGVGSMITPALSSVGKWMALIRSGRNCRYRRKKQKRFGKITGGFGACTGITNYLSGGTFLFQTSCFGSCYGSCCKGCKYTRFACRKRSCRNNCVYSGIPVWYGI